MTGTDLESYVRCFTDWASSRKSVKKVLVVNPDLFQESLMKGIFPNAEVTSLSYPAIDLSKKRDDRYDIVFISNTLMCSPDPGGWLENVLSYCEEVWLQEMIRAWRERDSELSPQTGDVTRFTFPVRGETSRVSGYDIESDQRFSLLEVEFYSDNPISGARDCRKFLACIKKASKPNSRATRSRAERPASDDASLRKEDTAGGDPAGAKEISDR